MAVDVKFSRQDCVYRPPDVVDGTIVITCPASLSHQGIRLTAVGTATTQLNSRSVGLIAAVYNSLTPLQLLNKTVDIAPAGKLAAGKLELPFHIALDHHSSGASEPLYETYHGAYINIQYMITAEVLRGYLQKALSASTEFIVEGRGLHFRRPLQRRPFYITSNTQHHALLPSIRAGGFTIAGNIANDCLVTEPVTGELRVDHSDAPILSIDIQLLRIESVEALEDMVSEKTDIQTTQIADGDICRGLVIPIYLVLPRLFTCPTLFAGIFSLQFELSIVVTFDAGHARQSSEINVLSPKQWMARETIPLRLWR